MNPVTHSWLAVLALVLVSAPIALALSLAVRSELKARAGRHRGIFRYSGEKLKAQSEPPGIAALEDGSFIWSGSVIFPTVLSEDTGIATLTLTPREEPLNIPLLADSVWGPPPPFVTLEDIERIQADAVERHKRERLAEINSVVCQHERVYHPLDAA